MEVEAGRSLVAAVDIENPKSDGAGLLSSPRSLVGSRLSHDGANPLRRVGTARFASPVSLSPSLMAPPDAPSPVAPSTAAGSTLPSRSTGPVASPTTLTEALNPCDVGDTLVKPKSGLRALAPPVCPLVVFWPLARDADVRSPTKPARLNAGLSFKVSDSCPPLPAVASAFGIWSHRNEKWLTS